MKQSNIQLTAFYIILSILLVSGTKSVSVLGQGQIFETEISTPTRMHFFLYLPDGYEESNDSFPLMLFLHGGGESGRDTSGLTVHGPPKLIRQGVDFPFILLAPQNPYPRKFWDVRAVASILKLVREEYRVDSTRIYITGLSRGGMGTWMMLMNYHNTFAAAIPISGAVPTAYHMWVPEIPIWIFHGGADPVIPVDESVRIYERLSESGKPVKLTIYPDTGHDAWTRTYENSEVFEWLLQQHR